MFEGALKDHAGRHSDEQLTREGSLWCGCLRSLLVRPLSPAQTGAPSAACSDHMVPRRWRPPVSEMHHIASSFCFLPKPPVCLAHWLARDRPQGSVRQRPVTRMAHLMHLVSRRRFLLDRCSAGPVPATSCESPSRGSTATHSGRGLLEAPWSRKEFSTALYPV